MWISKVIAEVLKFRTELPANFLREETSPATVTDGSFLMCVLNV